MSTGVGDYDLAHHGDRDTGAGLVDLAVNVRQGEHPTGLRQALADALGDLRDYPDQAEAISAVADRHGRPPSEVLLTAGGAEAFVLLARALRPRHAVVVHPQFTEPEAALRAAGHPVTRILLPPPFTLDAGGSDIDGDGSGPGAGGSNISAGAGTGTGRIDGAGTGTGPIDSAGTKAGPIDSAGTKAGPIDSLIPAEADLVMIGNPTNPTSVLHPRAVVESLLRPERVVVVDEAFMDSVPGESQSLAGAAGLPGLVVLRSLTKTWGLAGLRCGYLLAPEELAVSLATAQALWPVSSPALVATRWCSGVQALAQTRSWAQQGAADRRWLVAALRDLDVDVITPAEGPFLLLHHGRGEALRAELRRLGYATRRGDTFPGLDQHWLRIAVREHDVAQGFVTALRSALDTVARPA